jgi:hypothetical protein
MSVWCAGFPVEPGQQILLAASNTPMLRRNIEVYKRAQLREYFVLRCGHGPVCTVSW